MPYSGDRWARWLDWAIAGDLRRETDLLTRSRVVVGAAIILGVWSLVLVATVPIIGASWIAGALYLGCAAMYAAAIGAIKCCGSLRTGAWLVAVTLAGVMIFMSVQEHGGHLALSMWNAAIPLFVTYTVGTRAGFATAAVLAPIFVGAWFVDHAGYERDWIDAPRLDTFGAAMEVLALPLITAFGAVYRSGRDRAQRRLEHTIDALTAERRKLTSVIESTEDSIVSVDADLRVTLVNAGAKAFFGRTASRARIDGARGLFDNLSPERREIWKTRFEQAANEGVCRSEEHYVTLDGKDEWWEVTVTPIIGNTLEGFTVYGHGITRRKTDEMQLANLHRDLVAASRRAGMADVATSMLHNIGNVLTSANVSATRLEELVGRDRRSQLARLRDLLPSDREALVNFCRDDPRAHLLAPYLAKFAEALDSDTAQAHEELAGIHRALDHVRAIISDQQDLAVTGSMLETCSPTELVETAVRLSTDGPVESVTLDLECDDELPQIETDRHKAIQILANLVVNARDAVMKQPQPSIRIAARRRDQRVAFTVTDNGVGIDPAAIVEIFRHGYTTKKNGHGFGLHSAGNDAAELGGHLEAHSEGLGRGASFTLELPISPPDRLRQRFVAACA